MDGRDRYWPIHFWPICVFQCFHNLCGPERWGPKGGVPQGGGPNILRFLSLSHHQLCSFCLSLCVCSCVSSWNSGGVLKRRSRRDFTRQPESPHKWGERTKHNTQHAHTHKRIGPNRTGQTSSCPSPLDVLTRSRDPTLATMRCSSFPVLPILHVWLLRLSSSLMCFTIRGSCACQSCSNMDFRFRAFQILTRLNTAPRLVWMAPSSGPESAMADSLTSF